METHDDYGFPHVDAALIKELENRFPPRLPTPEGYGSLDYRVGMEAGQRAVIEYLKEWKRREDENIHDVSV